MHNLILQKFERHLGVSKKISNKTYQNFDYMCKVSLHRLRLKKNKIIFFGNGGSASDSLHFVSELVSKFLKPKRKSINAISLSSNISTLTSIGNDYDYHYIFKRQLESAFNKGDIVIALSTSGVSKNIVEALKFLNKKDADSFLFSKEKCGSAKKYSKFQILIPSNRVDDIQEFHYMFLHSFCDYLDQNI